MSEQNYQDPYAQQSATTSQPVTDPYAQSSNSYGAPQEQYGQMAPAAGSNYPAGVGGGEHPQAQTVFILGIVGIFIGLCSWIAWYMGGKAKKEIAAGAPYRFEGNLKTGYLLGKIFGIIYIVVGVLSLLANLATFAAVMSQSHS